MHDFQHPVDSFEYNEDEINQIQLDEKESFLAAWDDSGEVKIIGLHDKKVYKTLRLKHTNICSSICFRPRKPWEIVSGGMDSKLLHWDFSRPRCVNILDMHEVCSVSADADAYMINPPFVHHLCASADGQYLACALENGLLGIFDLRKKHVHQLFNLHAHLQGASQVAFLNNSVLVSGGNDSCIVVWDLNKANQGPGGDAAVAPAVAPATNGHSEPHDAKNANISQLCKVQEIRHSSKINWLKPFRHDGQQYLAIADQTSDLTILPITVGP
jgi:WD40 repeat protein